LFGLFITYQPTTPARQGLKQPLAPQKRQLIVVRSLRFI